MVSIASRSMNEGGVLYTAGQPRFGSGKNKFVKETIRILVQKVTVFELTGVAEELLFKVLPLFPIKHCS